MKTAPSFQREKIKTISILYRSYIFKEPTKLIFLVMYKFWIAHRFSWANPIPLSSLISYNSIFFQVYIYMHVYSLYIGPRRKHGQSLLVSFRLNIVVKVDRKWLTLSLWKLSCSIQSKTEYFIDKRDRIVGNKAWKRSHKHGPL